EAPKGYSLNSEPQTVKIATDTADFGSEVSVKNSPWTAPFIITKKNLGGELLPNCEFEILDENERQITTGITDENGIATFSLGYGKYFYHEIAAPEEYIIDDTLYPFEITEEGVSVYAEMTNSLKEGSIKVTKSTTGNLNVKDIGFIVKGISDTNSDIERELFTDENGEALFENLPIGKYTVTEDGSTVPYGYLVADSKQVTVAYAQTVDTDMVNEKVLDTKQADVYRHSLDSVVQFVVSQRCNLSGKIDLYADVDVSALDLIKNARDMILFSRAVQHAAKDTLFEIEKEVIAIDRKNEALDNAKTAKQESTSDRVDDILQDLIKLKFSQEQILALKQAVVAAAQNGEHNIRHWVSVRYSPDELQHISSLVADYYSQSVIEHSRQNVQAVEVQDNSADTMT
ncbi:MSCRAMM family protein, partial [Ruminococcus sp.]